MYEDESPIIYGLEYQVNICYILHTLSKIFKQKILVYR